MIINSAALAALGAGFKTSFDLGSESYTPIYQKIAMDVASTGSSETYIGLGNTTMFREWLGDRVIQNLSAFDYTIKNKDFENTIGVPRNAIEDGNLGQFDFRFKSIGQDAAEHPDRLIFELLEKGESELGYDGQYFFDTDHEVNGASVSNVTAGAEPSWYLLDSTKQIKPLIFQKRKDYNFVSLIDETDENVFFRKEYIYGVDARVNAGFGLWQLAHKSSADLTATNFEASKTAMTGLINENGKPMRVRPSILLVPPSLESKALSIVAPTLANGATNVNANSVEVVVASWLASS
jgi:phage major head subunit gpT-like protein